MNNKIVTQPSGDFNVEAIGVGVIPPENDTIVFTLNPNREVLKISPEGFWVRGVKVPQDEKEAESVYKAFRQFLVWSALTHG
jgi:hypothetical protein